MDDLLPGMLHLAPDGGDTLTRQLTDQLRGLITTGRLTPGQRLPSSRQLAQSLGLSRNTASFAIEQLAAEGYVVLSAGRRPEVAEGLSLDRRKLSSRNGRGARIALSSLGERPATLGLAPDSQRAAAAVSAGSGRRARVSAR